MLRIIFYIAFTEFTSYCLFNMEVLTVRAIKVQ